MFKIGKLYSHNKTDLEPRFCEIKNNKIQNQSFWSKRTLIKSNQPIMIIEQFNMTMATAMAMATGMATGMAMTDWKEVKDLWKRDKKIPGYKCLIGNKIIWISNIDLKYFNIIN